jgi:hypothetical protein
VKKCTYLGHIIGDGKVRPEDLKIKAVAEFPTPRTKKAVRAFLGLTTPECDAAFRRLKQALCTAPILQSPNFEREFTLQTDASNRGIGAVLSQADEECIGHPVAYYSYKLLPREERYVYVIPWLLPAYRVYTK